LIAIKIGFDIFACQIYTESLKSFKSFSIETNNFTLKNCIKRDATSIKNVDCSEKPIGLCFDTTFLLAKYENNH
jgi:hypothetical protein